MPSQLHETLITLFRDRPALAPDLLMEQFGIPVPAFDQARLSSAELSDITPTEYRADAVVTLTVNENAVLAVVVEAQLKADIRKRRSWPAYVATLHARLGCPVALLVVCPKSSVAARCAVPIKVGEPGFVLSPLVLGPDQVPMVTDPAEASRRPQLAVLSAMVHGGEPDPAKLFEALLTALHMVEVDHAKLYADVVLKALPVAAREYLETLMKTKTHPYQSDFARRYFDQGEAEGKLEGKAEGKAEGRASSVLNVLRARGIEVPAAVHDHVTGCEDLDELDRWVSRAVTVERAQDLFA